MMLSPMGLLSFNQRSLASCPQLDDGNWFVATAIGNKLTAIGVY
jgi:hypothetical protein